MLLLLPIFMLANSCAVERENIIQNNCEFDILSIKKK